MASILSSIASALTGRRNIYFTNELTGTPCWTDASVKSIDIISESANSDSPLSNEQVSESSVFTGLLAVDVQTTKVIRPVRIKAVILTNNISLLESIMSLFSDTSVTLSVRSRAIISGSMAIETVAIEQVPDMLSATRVTVLLSQVQPPQVSTFDPLQSADSNNLGLGVQTLSSVGPSLSSAAVSAGSLVSTATTAVGSLYNRFRQNIGL